MDFKEPLQALVPGTTGRLLGVLTRTSMPLSGRALAALADVSPTQATRVLPRLVDLGLVESTSAPPAILYSLAPAHVATDALRALSQLAGTFVDRLATRVARLEPRPACVGIFGSFARGAAVSDSDIDILIIRPAEIADDDDAWTNAVDSIRADAADLSGNRIDILEVGQTEIPQRLACKTRLWRDIRRDLVVVSGPPLDQL